MVQASEAPVRHRTADMRWGVERRLEFIEFRLYWEGRLNRRDLMEFFGISVPQASADIARYLEMAPDSMEYDKRAKCYVTSDRFDPQLMQPSSDRYLAQLLSTAYGILEPHESWIGVPPMYDISPSPGRSIDPLHLKLVLRAITGQTALHIEYQSMSRPEPLWRWISPHALGHDGFRWHARAFCHIDETFKDFVIARMLNIGEPKPHEADPELDLDWQKTITVRIGPHTGLTESQRRVVELDYGMSDGELRIEVRRALIYYFLKRFGLDTDPDARAPCDQQIVLINRDEVLA